MTLFYQGEDEDSVIGDMLLEALCHKTGIPRLDSCLPSQKFSSDLIPLSTFSSPLTGMIIFLRCKVGPACRADSRAVIVAT